MCGSWDTVRNRQNFLSLWTAFCPFIHPPLAPPMDPENQNFKKMKKTLEAILILQMFNLNDSNMIYGFSDMECNRQIFLSYWTVFCPFSPLTTHKIKIFKNWKKPLELSSFHTSIPKIMTICCTVPEIWHVTDLIVVFILGYFLPFYLPNSPKNQNLEKVKKTLEISSFYNSVPKIMIICYTVPEIWCVTDVIISHFWPFFALLPLTAWKMKIKKQKTNLEISSFYISVPKIVIRWFTIPGIWCMTDVIAISHFRLFLALLPP